MNDQQESKNIKLNNSDFTFLTNQKSWLKIPADGSLVTFTGNADEAAKEFFNALIRVRDGYISALKAERDAQQKRADALAVENVALKDINAWCKTEALQNMYREFKTAEAIGCAEVDCMHDAMLVAIMHAPKTPATDAALAAIEARAKVEAIELLIGRKKRELADMHPDTHAFGMTSALIRNQIRCLESFATELRETK
ncbi:hypothetical protein [Serratia marcescens]|uniref:hypothetical protein n=1 Tax=Serratia marcescens TaxID=615 RepID=UPI00396F3E4A